MTGKWFGIVALLLAASSMVGCGSDDESGGGAEAKTSCNAYCDAAIAKPCADSTTCKEEECAELDKSTGACATELKRYYDCLKAQPDVCGQTCELDVNKCT